MPPPIAEPIAASLLVQERGLKLLVFGDGDQVLASLLVQERGLKHARGNGNEARTCRSSCRSVD